MSKFVCKNGKLIFQGSPAFLDGSWCVNNVTIDISSDTVDYVCMGDDGWMETFGATKNATFSWETALDDFDGVDLQNTIGNEGILIFDTDDTELGLSYNASVIINSISINAPVDDIATVSWEATCDGEISEDVSS